MKFTVFGGRGFIGTHLVRQLSALGYEVNVPARDYTPQAENLGRVIYAAGVTGDFLSRPLDTMRAHVGLPVDILEKSNFDSFVYLSSTRVYGTGVTDEHADVSANPTKKDHLYNLSKLAGESLCLSMGKRGVRVARLSNVYGADLSAPNFLSSILSAARNGQVDVHSDPRSAKDYISIGDVVGLLTRIALNGKDDIYNVASGENVTNQEITDLLHMVSGCRINYGRGAPTLRNAPISVKRTQNEFGFQPVKLLDVLPSLMKG